MTYITNRPYNQKTDQNQIEDLLVAFRCATRVDTYPTLWRFRLLLASRVWEPDLDTQVWENKQGVIIGFAMFWKRQAVHNPLTQPSTRAPHTTLLNSQLVSSKPIMCCASKPLLPKNLQ